MIELTPFVRQTIESRFPFTLTDGQNAAVADLARDLASPIPMRRQTGCAIPAKFVDLSIR